jgi:hypothetical protein
VAKPALRRGADGGADPHALAHLGAVDAALAAGEAILMAAAAEVDADPLNRKGSAELIARRVRAVVETAVDEVINRTARALGPCAAVSGRRACAAGGRPDDLRPAEPRRTRPRTAGPTAGRNDEIIPGTEQHRPLRGPPAAGGGTPTHVWLDARRVART